jgi:HEAT repeat protein
MTTPAVASHIVARLGATRDETERSSLVHLISQVGMEGALALADALEESRDRFQRRAFLDAMVALGPMGLEMAERMVRDPRWFVVRNGVTVIGELGGEEAVTHLTATLANADSRVRRETVLSLAKVGGLDAEMLLLGMLNDGEPEVRAAACRGLGALKSDRALRSLLGALKDHDPGVQVDCLRALGQIGDPGAVRLVEKRALGGLFSRPTQEVRIAAFRALAGIGTPQALRTLEKGAMDRDQGVRTIVRALMGEG